MPVWSRILPFISKPLVVLHLIFLIQLTLFVVTTIRPFHISPPDRSPVMLRGHLIYTALIRQAKDGAWCLKIPHTTRETPTVCAHLFFVGLGKVAAVFNIDPPLMYMAARVLAAYAVFWATWWFIAILLPKRFHAIALLIILFWEPGPTLASIKGAFDTWYPSIFSYYPQVSTFRHFGLPHHTLGEAIGLVALGLMFQAVDTPKKYTPILLAAASFLGMIVLPPYFMIVGLVVMAPWFLWALWTKTTSKVFPVFALVGAIVGALGLFMKHEFDKGIPWKDFNQDEKHWVTNADIQTSYIATLALSIPFVAFAWVGILKLWNHITQKDKRTLFLMTTWTIGPMILVPFTVYPWFPLANFRLMDGYNYVPAGILAVFGLWAIELSIKKIHLRNIILTILLSFITAASILLTYQYTRQTFREQDNIWANHYPLNAEWDAIAFLNSVPKMSGVMITNHFGEILPEYAPVRSYIGSTPGFYDWPDRFYKMRRFYTGEMTDNEVIHLIQTEDISYVWYSYLEKSYTTTPALYPEILETVFENPVVTIYAVSPSVRSR